jgi:hypothetical protein
VFCCVGVVFVLVLVFVVLGSVGVRSVVLALVPLC